MKETDFKFKIQPLCKHMLSVSHSSRWEISSLLLMSPDEVHVGLGPQVEELHSLLSSLHLLESHIRFICRSWGFSSLVNIAEHCMTVSSHF